MKQYLAETKLLDYYNKDIQSLVKRRNWNQLHEYKKIEQIYYFVRDEIVFGYNRDDSIPASMVIKDGYGQCNTKAVLFMALLRAVGIPCRLHGFYIDKKLQKGAIPGYLYKLSPNEIVHTWAEIYYEGNWIDAEGVILDRSYLANIQNNFTDCTGSFCGYGVAVDNIKNPPIDWNGNSTYIQKNGITKDLGVFDTPDEFFSLYYQKLSPIKKWLYGNFVRYLINHNVAKIRRGSF